MGISGPQYRYYFKGTDTSKGFQATGNSRIKRVPILAISIGIALSVPIRPKAYRYCLYFKNSPTAILQVRTDTVCFQYRYVLHFVPIPVTAVPIPEGQKPTNFNGHKAYRYHDTRTGTICTSSADLAAKSTSTAPNISQRSSTARRWFGMIKDTSKHP
ncbi:hypothetical protein V6N11_010606 [Hibiscus sabdariffa]|uniref:Uncharacterized protein n=1 Tax=Hibiscus sabdariffa TaxID=183260 RepID=A0ABR2S6D0_9ROSI